ncbi:uncharacterized protein [Spinacia oleracea]|uniref:Retrotransposon gag domain-containing protein n=1 Tax=Spinacia oleracea TaxID=3562 RepID=A0ABM3RPA6_SPIOL|nr:uncharacterized protein LOC130471399 [Spinacia oleracea]
MHEDQQTDPSTNPNSAYYLSNNDLNASKLVNIVFEEPLVGRSVFYLRTTREIWLDLEERFFRSSGPQLYTIQHQLSDLNQEENEEISSFFTKIKLLWDRLDGLDPIPACHNTYDESSANHIKGLRIVISRIKSRRNSTSTEYNLAQNLQHLQQEDSIIISLTGISTQKALNHTIDKCWKLHGYPKDFKNRGKRVATAAQLEVYVEKEKQSGIIHATFTEE